MHSYALKYLNFTPELRDVGSETICCVGRGYKRIPATDYLDYPANLTERQANFYCNLVALALENASSHIPVAFVAGDGREMYLDRGCIKIAEHAGFIAPLEDDETGVVSSIVLAWRASLS